MLQELSLLQDTVSSVEVDVGIGTAVISGSKISRLPLSRLDSVALIISNDSAILLWKSFGIRDNSG